jgi:ATP-binding cassette, subfamily A (ABC1), member 3
MVLMYMTAYMTIESNSGPDTIEKKQELVHYTLGLISPVAQLLRALILMSNLFSVLCSGAPPTKASYPGAFRIYGGPIVYLIGQSLFLFAMLLWADHRFSLGRIGRMTRLRRPEDPERIITEEQDVAEEIARVETSNDGLKVMHVSKTFKTSQYGDIVAVDDLSFGVKQGEVFALVGPNGGERALILLSITPTSPK